MSTVAKEMLMLAGQMRERCTEALMDWGEAVNRAEANPGDERLKKIAQEKGRDAMVLGMALASRLR